MDFLAKLLLFWYIYIYFSTEIFSYFHLLTINNILVSEFLFVFGILIYFKKELKRIFKQIIPSVINNSLLAAIFILTFVQGFASAPSTTDAMVYHLTRIMYWLQEKTVAQDVIRNPSDYKSPFQEYVMLHLYSILNNDRLVFFAQWVAFAVSVYLSGVIASQLGADKKIQKLVRIFVATLPIAVMEATSTQVDMAMGVLLLISIHLALVLLKKTNILYTFLFGLSLGLGIFAKAYFFMFMIIPLGVVSYNLLAKRFFKITIYTLFGSLLIAFFIQLRFIFQNLRLFGSFQGKEMYPEGERIYTNEIHNLPVIISNVIRNAFTNFPVPFFNFSINKLIAGLHNFIGLGLNDPRTTCCSTKFSVSSVIFPQEDIVANPIQIILCVIAVFILLTNWEKIKKDLASQIFVLSIISFFIYSLFFKWFPYNPRTQMPFFIIVSIVSPIIIFKSKWFFKKFIYFLVISSVFLAFGVMFLNVAHPYISYSYFYSFAKKYSKPLAVQPEALYIRPRMEQYFNAEYYWYEPYSEITDLVENKRIGKVTFDLMDDFEYPLWMMLKTKKVGFYVVPKKSNQSVGAIISTSGKPYSKEGYITECFKTKIDYGYACFSKLKMEKS